MVVIVLTLVSLGHLATHRVPFMPKWAWAVLVIVGAPFGAVIYIAIVMFGFGVNRDDAEGHEIN